MIFNVLWTEDAINDLREIVTYIVTDNLSAAKKLFNDLRTEVGQLKLLPLKFRVVPELMDTGITHYRELVYKHCRVIYKCTDSAVVVMAVIDSRRDLESFLNRRMLR